MSDPVPLSLVAAFDLLRNKKPTDWTPEETAALRSRYEANPSFFSAAGGAAAVERLLTEAEAHQSVALKNQDPAAQLAKPSAASVSRATPARRRRVELALYCMAVIAAASGLYFMVSDKEPPVAPLANKTRPSKRSLEDKPAKTVSAAQPTQADDQTAKRQPSEKKADPVAAPVEPDGPDFWQGWKIDSQAESLSQQDQWDASDPSHLTPARALNISGGPVRLSRRLNVRAEDRWLMVHARPVAPVYAGEIKVSIDGNEAAKVRIGAGETEWPLYIPVTASPNAGRRFEIVFTPGAAQQKIAFWKAGLTSTQTRQPLPESPRLSELRSPDPAERVRGAKLAAQVVDPLALPGLVRALDDPQPAVRLAAATTLEKYNIEVPPIVVQALLKKLRDADLDFRQQVAKTLIALDNDLAWKGLSPELNDHPDAAFRLHLARQLATRKHPAIAVAFQQAIASQEDALRLAAVAGLNTSGEAADIKLLIQTLADPEPAVRRAAATVLAGRGDPESEQALIVAITTHPDWLVRRAALTRFHTLPAVAALAAISTASESPDDQLRRSAATALGKLPGAEVDRLLLKLLHDPEPGVQHAAAESLGGRPSAASDEVMLQLLASSTDGAIWKACIRHFSLHAVPPPRLVAVLREVLRSPHAAIRRQALEMIQTMRASVPNRAVRLGQTPMQTLAAPPYSELLELAIAALDDPVYKVREAAVSALRTDPHSDADRLLVRVLSMQETALRLQAAERFVSYKAPSNHSLEFYRAARKEQNGLVLSTCVVTLMTLQTPEAIALQTEMLSDPAPGIRAHILWCRTKRYGPSDQQLLPPEAQTGDAAAVPHLARLLNDPELYVRYAAVNFLAGNPDPAAVRLALDVMRSHPDHFVRMCAMSCLSGKPLPPEAIDGLRHVAQADSSLETRYVAIRLLGAYVDATTSAVALIPLLADPVRQVRNQVAEQLSASSTPEAEEAMLGLLANAEPDLRGRAIQRFTRAPSSRALAGLSAAATAPDYGVRLQALGGLAQLKEPEVTALLARALDDPVAEVRELAAETLRGRPEPQCADMMLKALSHADPNIRRIAAVKFGSQPNPATLPALLVAVGHEDDTLRSTALRAIALLEDPSVMTALATALKDPVPEVRLTAAGLLAPRGGAAAEEAVIAALMTHQDMEVRRLVATRFQAVLSPKALDALTAAAKNDDDALRLLAVQGLGNIPVVEAITPLIAALEDPSELVRQAALTSLTSRPDPRAQAAVAAYQAKLRAAP